VHELDGLQAHHLSCAIAGLLPVGGGIVGLLGLTYKPGVSLLDESQSLLLSRYLRAGADGRIKVVAHDPDVAVGMSVQTLHELVEQSDVIVVMTPKQQFLQLEGFNLSGKILFDCWGYIGETNADKHIVLGVGK
jgi:UDP-N-acetyl-D-mannosaminuronate dehydrogenase